MKNDAIRAELNEEIRLLIDGLREDGHTHINIDEAALLLAKHLERGAPHLLHFCARMMCRNYIRAYLNRVGDRRPREIEL